MNLRTILRSTCVCSVAALMASSVFAAPVEEINLTGSGIGGHTSLQSALDSVDDGGVINFIEAGTYVEPSFVVVPGGKTITVNNTSGGIVIHQNQPGSGFYNEDTLTGPVNATFSNYIMERIDGTGTVFDIDQSTTQTIDLAFTNMILRATAAADAGEAMKIDDDANVLGGGTFAAVTITATDTTFSCARDTDDSKSAIRIQDAGWQNLTLTLNNCTIFSAASSGIRYEGGDNNNITISGGSISAPGDRAFEVDDPINNNTIVIEDCDITAERRAIYVDEDTDGNSWSVQRNTIDISGGDGVTASTSERRAVNIDHELGNNNVVNIHNNVVITQEDSDLDENERCIYISGAVLNGNTFDIFHNTLLGSGVGGGQGISIAGGAEPNFSNNIFLELVDPISGSIGAGVRSNNLFAGTTDGSGGSGSFDSTVVALDLDSNYVPNSGSTALNAGDPSATIATAVGNVDRNGAARPAPGATNPDIGAFEVGATLAVSNWELYN